MIIPWGFHPFPSRTRKLSPTGPIVLYAKVCGRVGRRRIKIKAGLSNQSGLFRSWINTLAGPRLREVWNASLACAEAFLRSVSATSTPKGGQKPAKNMLSCKRNGETSVGHRKSGHINRRVLVSQLGPEVYKFSVS